MATIDISRSLVRLRLRGSLFFWLLYGRDCMQVTVVLELGRGKTMV